MAVDNPTIVPEASNASHEWKNVNAQVSALLASVLQRIPKAQKEDEEEQQEKEGQDNPQAKEKDKPRSVEIQIGKTKVFKGIEGQEPQKNTLSPAQVSALQKLVNTPSTEAGQDLDSSVQNLGRVVTIKVDKEPVLRVANGQLDNKLEPDPEAWIITPEAQPEAIAQPEPEKQRAVPEFVNTSQSSDRFPEIPPDFGIEKAKGINADDVIASGDSLFAHSYLGLETIRQDLNDSYRRGSEPGFEFIANAPHVAPLRERFEAEKTNFEFRLNNAIEQGKYKVPDAQAQEQTAPEQTQPEPLEPLGHHQPLGHQEQGKPSLIDLAQQIETNTTGQDAIHPETEAIEEEYDPYENEDPEDRYHRLELERWEDRELASFEAQYDSPQVEHVQPEAESQSSKYQTILPDIPQNFGIPEAQGMTSDSAEKLGGSSLREAFEALKEQRDIIHVNRDSHNSELPKIADPERIGDGNHNHHIESFWDQKKLDHYENLKQGFSRELNTALEKQGQQSEPQPKRSLGETLAKDFANSFDLPPETKEYFKETGAAIKEGAKAAWAKLKVKVKETAIAGVNQAKTQLQSRKAANTAVQLLDSDPQGRSFKGEDYNITAVNRHTISVTDAEQNEILRFEETPLGPKILKSELTPKQLKEFAQVRGQLQKHGTENLLNTQPTARMQFLQGFAPQGDRAEVQKLHNSSTISRVEQIAQTLKPTQAARNFETHDLGEYSIKRQGDNLQVMHQERGVILSRKGTQLQGNLSDRDISHFKGLSNQVSALLVRTEPEASPVAVAAASDPSPTKTAKPSGKSDFEIGD